MSYVSVSGVQKAFGTHDILKGVSFGVERGQFVSLVGPSGCGKSTLLRLIAGLDNPTSGEIAIDGRRMNNVSAKDRDIAFVFQSYALYPHMTVRDNLGFSLLMSKTPPKEAQLRIASAATTLGIEGLLDRYPRQLSGGQRQRVAMGRAIVRNPKVFLFDEPLSNLDAELRVRMRAEIRELHGRLATTTIYVTHDQVEAMTMSDQIVVLRDGAVEQIGTPLDLYDFPANTFVAGFIGSPSMNFVPATVGSDGDIHLCDGTRLPIEGRVARPFETPILCGIRPEHIQLVDDGIPAKVRLLEVHGAETHVTVRLGDADVTIVIHQRRRLAAGDVVQLALEPTAIHVFDAQTKQRVDRA